MHFQNIISTLNCFWADQGCLLLQPYDTEKGAGTMSPHTLLRACTATRCPVAWLPIVMVAAAAAVPGGGGV